METSSYAAGNDLLAHAIILGDPVPKGRPRAGKGGRIYTPQRTLDAEALVAWSFREQNPGLRPAEGPVGMAVGLYRATARRVDLDNLLKTVCDALNGIAFVDDSQILDLHARLTLKDSEPRTEVFIYLL